MRIRSVRSFRIRRQNCSACDVILPRASAPSCSHTACDLSRLALLPHSRSCRGRRDAREVPDGRGGRDGARIIGGLPLLPPGEDPGEPAIVEEGGNRVGFTLGNLEQRQARHHDLLSGIVDWLGHLAAEPLTGCGVDLTARRDLDHDVQLLLEVRRQLLAPIRQDRLAEMKWLIRQPVGKIAPVDRANPVEERRGAQNGFPLTHHRLMKIEIEDQPVRELVRLVPAPTRQVGEHAEGNDLVAGERRRRPVERTRGNIPECRDQMAPAVVTRAPLALRGCLAARALEGGHHLAHPGGLRPDALELIWVERQRLDIRFKRRPIEREDLPGGHRHRFELLHAVSVVLPRVVRERRRPEPFEDEWHGADGLRVPEK